ncbi:hypothetical protein CYMTET_3392 [Cymbomonas tetramitiformis]|uniref:Uncharacterized protein n=1 Tax=Cymbomonas tetramitiformis TaxID=36881 RepID=A0AAE0H377_9CHLO|nr:hypothetical protein CYMTET_3392 [Cymbomonas tetramitiformis]
MCLFDLKCISNDCPLALPPPAEGLPNDDCFLNSTTPGAAQPAFFAIDDPDEESWPAFRSGPARMPSFAGNTTAGTAISDAAPHDVPAPAP